MIKFSDIIKGNQTFERELLGSSEQGGSISPIFSREMQRIREDVSLYINQEQKYRETLDYIETKITEMNRVFSSIFSHYQGGEQYKERLRVEEQYYEEMGDILLFLYHAYIYFGPSEKLEYIRSEIHRNLLVGRKFFYETLDFTSFIVTRLLSNRYGIKVITGELTLGGKILFKQFRVPPLDQSIEN